MQVKQKCTINQAEQLAKLRALKHTEKIQTEDKTATIYADSQITLDSLQNGNNHTFRIEEIKKMEMKKTNWKIKLRWVKAHVGIRGNELDDTLA